MSRRLLPYADPKLYRVSKATDYGLYHLEDPATGQVAAGYRDAVTAERLIRYEDLPPLEQPLNPDEEIWIEIKSNDLTQRDVWLQRQIIAQCETGEVRICSADKEDNRIIDLTKYAYHFIKPPSSVAAPTASERVGAAVDVEAEDSEIDSESETKALEIILSKE